MEENDFNGAWDILLVEFLTSFIHKPSKKIFNFYKS
jgi:hypothetical protein